MSSSSIQVILDRIKYFLMLVLNLIARSIDVIIQKKLFQKSASDSLRQGRQVIHGNFKYIPMGTSLILLGLTYSNALFLVYTSYK